MLPLWKTVWQILKSLDIDLFIHPANLYSLESTQEKENRRPQKTCTQMSITSLFIIAKSMETTEMLATGE